LVVHNKRAPVAGVPCAVPDPLVAHRKPPGATRREKQKPLGKSATLQGVLVCPDVLKSGRPTGFLDASDATTKTRRNGKSLPPGATRFPGLPATMGSR
jgi:hypothetical protein